MARRTHVPKFGNWDANDHMPYTVVFDNARQGRGKPINPNDPSENPSMFPAGKGGGGGPGARRHFNPSDPDDSTTGGADHHPQQGRQPQQERFQQERQPQQERFQQERQPQQERFQQERLPQQERYQQERQPQQERPTTQQQQGIVREGSGSGSGSGGARTGGQLSQQRATGAEERRRMSAGQANLPSRGPSADLSKRPSREGTLDRSVESPPTSFSADQSPSHPSGPTGSRFEGSAGGRGAGTRLGGNSPAWDPTRRKSTGEDGQIFAPATPTRSRFGNGKNTRDEAPTKGPSAALPKFGAWDAQDPGSGDGFTVIFQNARNERKSGGPVNLNKTPDRENKDLYDNSGNSGYQKRHSRHNSWFCCFSPRVNA